jgi:outer membrane lipoprotein SlyB
MKRLIPFIILLTLTSCASKPVLYPNRKFESVGADVAQGDVDKCMAKFDNFLKSSRGKKMLKGAGKGSIVGGAVGVVSGLITGNLAKGVAQGAAFGAAAGGASEGVSKDQLKESFVNKCLGRKGYEVIGWE